MNLSPVKSGNVEALLNVYLFLGQNYRNLSLRNGQTRYVMTKFVTL